MTRNLFYVSAFMLCAASLAFVCEMGGEVSGGALALSIVCACGAGFIWIRSKNDNIGDPVPDSQAAKTEQTANRPALWENRTERASHKHPHEQSSTLYKPAIKNTLLSSPMPSALRDNRDDANNANFYRPKPETDIASSEDIGNKLKIRPQTKKCPFCAEDILEQAIKCKFCGSMLDGSAQSPPMMTAPAFAPPVGRLPFEPDRRIFPISSRRPIRRDPALYRVGFGLRIGASLLDALLLSCISFIAVILFGAGFWEGFTGAMTASGSDEVTTLGVGILVAVGVFCVVCLMYNLIEVFCGASPGKLILGLRIAYADGRPGNFGVWFGRYIGKISPHLLYFIAGFTGSTAAMVFAYVWNIIWAIGCLFIFSAGKQTLYDMIAGAAVFKKVELDEINTDGNLEKRLARQLQGVDTAAPSSNNRQINWIIGLVVLFIMICLFVIAKIPKYPGKGDTSKPDTGVKITPTPEIESKEQKLAAIVQQLSLLKIPCDINTLTKQYLYYPVCEARYKIKSDGTGVVILFCISSEYSSLRFRHVIIYNYENGKWIFSGDSSCDIVKSDNRYGTGTEVTVKLIPPDL